MSRYASPGDVRHPAAAKIMGHHAGAPHRADRRRRDAQPTDRDFSRQWHICHSGAIDVENMSVIMGTYACCRGSPRVASCSALTWRCACRLRHRRRDGVSYSWHFLGLADGRRGSAGLAGHRGACSRQPLNGVGQSRSNRTRISWVPTRRSLLITTPESVVTRLRGCLHSNGWEGAATTASVRRSRSTPARW